MFEAARVLVLHQERMRELDADARQEIDGYVRRLTEVEDRCMALALFVLPNLGHDPRQRWISAHSGTDADLPRTGEPDHADAVLS